MAQDGKCGYFKLDSFEGKSAYLKAFASCLFFFLLFFHLRCSKVLTGCNNSLSSISLIVLHKSQILPCACTTALISTRHNIAIDLS